MIVTVRDLLGIAGLPTCRKNAGSWLKRNQVPLYEVRTKGGISHAVMLSDLPEKVRQAYLFKLATKSGLPPGAYDDEAHSEYLKAPAKMRSEAERKAAIACLLMAIRDSANWSDRIATVQKQFGPKGTSKISLKRLLKAIKGIDPINYAPALLADYKPA